MFFLKKFLKLTFGSNFIMNEYSSVDECSLVPQFLLHNNV